MHVHRARGSSSARFSTLSYYRLYFTRCCSPSNHLMAGIFTPSKWANARPILKRAEVLYERAREEIISDPQLAQVWNRIEKQAVVDTGCELQHGYRDARCARGIVKRLIFVLRVASSGSYGQLGFSPWSGRPRAKLCYFVDTPITPAWCLP